MKFLSYIVLCIGIASAAFAHSPLESTIPVDGGVVVERPVDLHLTFNNGIRLTRVELAGETIEAVDLDLTAYEEFTEDFTLQLPEIGNGSYTVIWRGLGADGHIQTGEFGFTVVEDD